MMKKVYFLILIFLFSFNSKIIPHGSESPKGENDVQVEEAEVVVDETAGKKKIQSQEIVILKKTVGKKVKGYISLDFIGFPKEEWETDNNEFEVYFYVSVPTLTVGDKCFFMIDGEEIEIKIDVKKEKFKHVEIGKRGKKQVREATRYLRLCKCNENDKLIKLLEKANDIQMSLVVCNYYNNRIIDYYKCYDKKDALAIGMKTFQIIRINRLLGNEILISGIIDEKGNMIVNEFKPLIPPGIRMGRKSLVMERPQYISGQTKYYRIRAEELE